MSEKSNVERIIVGREKDLGGFSVRRVLPYGLHRMVGPFIFFDHMGPAVLKAGKGMEVRPHPHINLATVSYLFEGCIEHRDSLGYDQLIEPGAINWMTAGRGIVHSERTPEHLLMQDKPMNGIQLWVALPDEAEEMEPSFHHHAKESLPSFSEQDADVKLLLGKAFGRESPVRIHSDLVYLEVNLAAGQSFTMPAEGRDIAVYNVQGEVEVEAESLPVFGMAIGNAASDITVNAHSDARLMIIGGKPVGKRSIYWNFVSSSEERIEQAKQEWAPGPRKESRRFPPIPTDHADFIPLPEEPTSASVKGTIM